MKKDIGILIDLDGTIYKGKEIIPQADRFVAEIRAMELPFLFVTNNSSRTPQDVAEHLCSMGIEAGPEQVYTSAQAAAQFMLERNNGNRAFIIGEDGLIQALLSAGFVYDDQQPEYVVQGIDRSFSYDKLKLAVKHIRNGSEYILTNPDLLLPADEGLVPGAGSISASIQAAAQTDPKIIGKPSPIIMNYAIDLLGLEPAQVWVLGDNLLTDIGAGKAAGCKTALVLSGITTRENKIQLEQCAGFSADFVCDHLMQFFDKLHRDSSFPK